MKLKAFALALLLAVGAPVASVTALAHPAVVPQLSCQKGYSDVALHLKITNNSAGTIEKGKTVHYAYKTSAGAAEVKGSLKLEGDLAPGQSTSILVNPLTAQETPVVQCTAAVRRRINLGGL